MDATEETYTAFEEQGPDACELCGVSFVGIGIWHQKRPKEAWLCAGCGEREQRASQYWHGQYLPAA